MTKEDLQDMKELLQEYHANILPHNMVTLYHATTKENAKQIIESQTMYAKEDGLFFSTLPNNQILGYGDTIITVTTSINKLQLDDQFSNELHFRIPCKAFTYYSVIAKYL